MIAWCAPRLCTVKRGELFSGANVKQRNPFAASLRHYRQRIVTDKRRRQLEREAERQARHDRGLGHND